MALEDALACAATAGTALTRVVEQSFQGLGQAGSVIGSSHSPDLFIDDFGHVAEVADNARDTAAHCLEQGRRQIHLTGRQHENIELRHQFVHIAALAEQRDVIADAGFYDRILDMRALATTANQHEPKPPMATFAQATRGLDEPAMIVGRMQARNATNEDVLAVCVAQLGPVSLPESRGPKTHGIDADRNDVDALRRHPGTLDQPPPKVFPSDRDRLDGARKAS